MMRGAGGYVTCAFACMCLASACGRAAHEAPTVTAQTAASASPAATGSAIPHGDHNPHFGGTVYMNGDLHFEAVLKADGSVRIYFSDATRSELPAATASGLTVVVTQKGQPPDAIAMHIDDSGESWFGRGKAIVDPAASARIAYTAFGKPYFIDAPFPQ
jgi:hypothetical protein